MSPHLDLTAPYAPLVRRIESEGSIDGQMLVIDHFLNHRIEPGFIFELAHELARRLSFFQPNVILTAEASGIAPALIVAQALSVPMVYAKKYSTDVEAPSICRTIPSPTKKGVETRLAISTRYIHPGQRVVIVDDFLANGRTAAALIEMAREAGADVRGAGFVVEKRFKQGREHIEALHVPVSTLAQVERLESGQAILVQPQGE